MPTATKPFSAKTDTPKEHLVSKRRITATEHFTKRATDAAKTDETLLDTVARFAEMTEWYCAVIMAVTGFFTILYSTTLSPTDNYQMVIGIVECGCAGVLVLYCTICRHKLSLWRQNGASGRMFILSGMAVVCFLAPQMGAMAGLCLASSAAASFYLSLKYEDRVSPEAKESWFRWIINSALDWSWKSYLCLVFFLGANVGFYILGDYIAEGDVAMWETLRIKIDPWNWHVQQGFGTICTGNLTLLLLSAVFGMQYRLQSVGESHAERGRCECFFKFLERAFERKKQLFFHRCCAFFLVIGIIGHVVANFNAYDNSGATVDYIRVIGYIPFVTGMLVLFLLFLIYMSATEKHQVDRTDLRPQEYRQKRDKIKNTFAFKFFKWGHRAWVLVIVALLFHGRGFWNPHFWKWVLGPIIIWSFDMCYRLGLGHGVVDDGSGT